MLTVPTSDCHFRAWLKGELEGGVKTLRSALHPRASWAIGNFCRFLASLCLRGSTGNSRTWTGVHGSSVCGSEESSTSTCIQWGELNTALHGAVLHSHLWRSAKVRVPFTPSQKTKKWLPWDSALVSNRSDFLSWGGVMIFNNEWNISHTLWGSLWDESTMVIISRCHVQIKPF